MKGTWCHTTQVISLLLLMVLGMAAYGSSNKTDKKSCPSAAELADNLVQVELNGWRNPLAKEFCLRPSLYHYLKKQKIEYADNPPSKKDIYRVLEKDLHSVKVNKVSQGDQSNTYVVDFEYVALAPSGKVEKIRDSFDMIIHNKDNQELVGCAGMTRWPQHVFTRDSCLSYIKAKK